MAICLWKGECRRGFFSCTSVKSSDIEQTAHTPCGVVWVCHAVVGVVPQDRHSHAGLQRKRKEARQGPEDRSAAPVTHRSTRGGKCIPPPADVCNWQQTPGHNVGSETHLDQPLPSLPDPPYSEGEGEGLMVILEYHDAGLHANTLGPGRPATDRAWARHPNTCESKGSPPEAHIRLRENGALPATERAAPTKTPGSPEAYYPSPPLCPANNKILKKYGPNRSVRWIRLSVPN